MADVPTPRKKTFAQKLHISPWVYYDDVNPGNTAHGIQARTSLSGLDYSPLRLVTMPSFVMGILVSMGGFLFGFDTGQISGFLAMPDFLQRFGQKNSDGVFYFSNVRSGLIVAMLSIGTLIGALVAAPIADLVGRRLSLSWWTTIIAVGLIVQISADTHWYQVMMGRWVSGLGVGALSMLVPMYQAETGPRHIRGALISTYQLFITIGIFFAACINYGTYEHQRADSGSWRISLGLGFFFCAVLGFGMLFMPETPRYAYRKGRKDEARETMMRVYGAPANHYVVAVELEEIEAKLQSEAGQKSTFGEWAVMLRTPMMPYRIVLGMVLQMFQQLTGANYFFYYGTVVFKATGINNSFVTQMILNGINMGVTPLGIYFVERFGRRICLITGSVWMFIMFLCFASAGHFALDRTTPENTPAAGTGMIVVAAFFILGFATTWGPMIWTICGELYPSRFRAKGMALSTASNWFWNFMLAFFTPFITGDIDFRYGYVFAACNAVGGILVYLFVMEGQGRTLEEIDTMYLSKIKPWKSNKWAAPPPHEIARIRKEAGTHDVVDEEAHDAHSEEEKKDEERIDLPREPVAAAGGADSAAHKEGQI